MPAVVIPINAASRAARREGFYCLLQLALPGAPLHDVGVLLLDPAADRLYPRLRSRWDDLAPIGLASGALPDDILEVLSALPEDIDAKAREMGAEAFLRSLEDSLSHTLRLTDREAVRVDSFTRTADRLFEEHVEPLPRAAYRTHLPLYSLRAAATRFGEDQQVEEEDWVRAPENLRLNENMFVVHVVGRSMEPRIPDGSLNIFRSPVVGSRQNKILLVELFGQLDDSARYTVKRYTSRKIQTGEDEWQHERIRLEPLNPEFSAFDLEEGGFNVVAEWICALE